MEISSGPIASCSSEHQITYQEWFNYADSDGDERITGNDAIKFFSLSNLPRPDLKKIWATADSRRQGFLGFNEFVAAMQLVSLAQSGHEVSNDHLGSEVDFENLDLPAMEGLDALLAKKRRSSKSGDSDQNGTPPPVQTSPSANWFSSNPSRQIYSSLEQFKLVLDYMVVYVGIIFVLPYRLLSYWKSGWHNFNFFFLLLYFFFLEVVVQTPQRRACDLD